MAFAKLKITFYQKILQRIISRIHPGVLP